MKRVTDFLTANPVFHLATMEGDHPRVRPFGFFMEVGGKLYFITGEQKKVAAQLRANPKFELCACSDKGEWLSLSGVAVFDTKPELVEKAFTLAPMLRDIYGKQDGPKAALFYADNAQAVLADMTGKTDTIKL